MEQRTKKLIAIVISLLLCGHVLLFYALPIKVFVLVFIALTILFLYIEWQGPIMISMSLILGTLIFGVFLQVSGINESVYYRPHEKFRLFDSDMNHGRYEKNIRFEMKMPHGDLKALALYEDVTPEPRKVTFHTDSLGFRNSKDYHGQKYLLVGDSFIVGNGTTQNEIITEQLIKEYNLDGYNLAHPGGPKDYVNYVKKFEVKFGNKHKVILFLFEGNDFPIFKEKMSAPLSEIPALNKYIVKRAKNHYRLFSKTDIYRFVYSRTSRFSLKKKVKNGVVDIRMIEGVPVSFYKSYISVSERDSLPNNPEIEEYIRSIKNKIAHIFFIPTKYRVYYKHITGLNSDEPRVLPHKQWELVQRIGIKYGIRVTDLTPALIEESNKMLQERKLTFWKDDTHWNKYGISIAAKIVAKNIVTQ